MEKPIDDNGAQVHAVVHTPGPWRYHYSGSMVMTDDGQMTVADVRGWGTLERQLGHNGAIRVMDANGRLIAAAPKLLLACKRALEMDCVSPDADEIYNELRDAIRLAEVV